MHYTQVRHIYVSHKFHRSEGQGGGKFFTSEEKYGAPLVAAAMQQRRQIKTNKQIND